MNIKFITILLVLLTVSAKAQQPEGSHIKGKISSTFSPDGKTMLSIGVDRVIKVWDIETCSLKHKFYEKSGLIVDLYSFINLSNSFSQDGKFFFINDYLYNLYDGTVKEIKKELFSFSPDNSYYTLATPNPSYEFKVKKYPLSAHLNNNSLDEVFNVRFKTDFYKTFIEYQIGKLLIFNHNGRKILFYNFFQNEPFFEISTPKEARIHLSFDKKLLFIDSYKGAYEIWDLSGQKPFKPKELNDKKILEEYRSTEYIHRISATNIIKEKLFTDNPKIYIWDIYKNTKASIDISVDGKAFNEFDPFNHRYSWIDDSENLSKIMVNDTKTGKTFGPFIDPTINQDIKKLIDSSSKELIDKYLSWYEIVNNKSIATTEINSVNYSPDGVKTVKASDAPIAQTTTTHNPSNSESTEVTLNVDPNSTSGLPTSSPFYNGPVDSLLSNGDRSLLGGAKLGVKTPALALMLYNRAAELEPNNPLMFTKIGTAYLYHQMYAEALENFAKSLAIDPMYPLAHYGLFKVAKDQAFASDDIPQGKLDALLRQCETFLGVAPEKYVFEKKEVNFVKSYLELYQKNRTTYNKYRAAIDNGADVQTLDLAFMASDIAKAGGKEMVNNLMRYAAELSKRNQNHAAAATIFKTLVNEGDPSVRDYWDAIVTDFAAFEEKDDAFALMTKAMQKYPNDPLLLSAQSKMNLDYGLELFAKGEITKAYQYLSKYKPDKSGTPLNYYHAMGVLCYKLKDYTCASKNLGEFVANTPDQQWKKYYPNLTEALNFSKKPAGTAPKIIDYYDSIQSYEDLYMQGSKLIDEGKYDEGLAKMLTSASFFERLDDKKGKAVCYSGIGRAYMYLRNREKSLEYLHKCLEAGPQSGGAYSNLGSCYMADGDFQKAEKYMMEGYQRFPDFPDLATNLMNLWFEQGSRKYKAEKYSEAITMYKKALQFKEHAQVYLFLGLACYLNYNNSEAKKYLTKAVEMEPSYLDAEVMHILKQ